MDVPPSPLQITDVGLAARRRPVGDDAAARQLDHTVGDTGDLAVVRDDQHGHPRSCLFLEHAENLDTRPEVELTGRFVGEQDRVPGRQHAGDRHSLLLAARQLVREVTMTIRETDLRQRLLRPRGRIRRACRIRTEAHVLERREAGNRLNVWKMKLTLCRRSIDRSACDAPLTSTPATRTDPEVGVSSAPIMFSNVVLPHPDGPTIATNAASSTCRLMPSSAVTSTSPTRYRLVRSSRSIREPS